MPVVYILQSQKRKLYYIGSTNNLQKRLNQHNSGRVRSTKSLLPLKLVLTESYKTYSEARKVESKLKRLKRKDYIDKIIKEGYIKVKP